MRARTIENISHSIAFTDECGVIYINKHLRKYSEQLYKRILKHEKGHTIGLYNTKDLALDYNNNISQFDLLGFCIAHPSGFVQYLPIVKVKDKIFYSWISALKLLITAGVIVGIWLMIKI